ncbi:SSU ribosomal protein S6p [hydrothermal vent metagenome]|uniref:SSU ribosomal protein S6p n=1 Tax=hydrothermal vent metagenome TaxID=652676 RepID=A0A3B1DHA0_9ZZZZ
MKTNHYESVVVLNATLEDAQSDSVLNRIEDQISSNSGQILNIDKWGRKRLAYPIHKQKSGFYVVYQYEAPRELIAKLERSFRLDENIIRFLTIKLTKKDLEHIAKKKAQVESEAAIAAEKVKKDVVDENKESND